MRQVHPAARPEPDLRPLPGPAGDRPGAAGQPEHPGGAPGPQPAARPRRHGVPEAHAVPDVDLRQHRLRRAPLRAPVQRGDGRAGRGLADARGALGRGEGQAAPERPQPLGRAAAAPVHRAHDRRPPRGDPPRRAGLGPRPDLDRQGRGADRRAEGRLHDRDRHPQHAAGGAHLAAHRLHVPGRAGRVRADGRDLPQPARAPYPGLHHRPLRLGDDRMAEITGRHTVRAFDEEMNALTGKIAEMGALAERQVADAVAALTARDIELAARVIEGDPLVDSLEEQVDRAVVRLLATRQPMAVDLRIISMALKISNDLERTSDYAVSIAKRAQRLSEQPELGAATRIPRMGEICLGMLKDVLDAYVERDVDKAVEVWERDKAVDGIYNSLFRELVTYMLEDPRTISRCIDLMFIAKNLERIGDHATNIAEKIQYMIHGTQINRGRHEVEG